MSNTASAVVTVANKLGLHARPATMFVKTAKECKATTITVRRCDQDEAVDGTSVMGMLTLGATEGTDIEITAVDADAEKAAEALNALVALVKSGFEE